LNDFGTYNDVDGDALSKIKITTLPGTGTLEYYNGSTWISASANQEFTVADISAGKLRYTGTASESLQFKVSDGTVYSDSAYTLTLTVIANTNVAPDAVNDSNFVYYTTSHSITGYVLPNDNDPDGSNASLVVSRASTGATLAGTIYTISAGTPFAADNETATYSSFSVTFSPSTKPSTGATVTLSGTGIPTGTTGVVTMSTNAGTIVLNNSAGLKLPANVTIAWGGSSPGTATLTPTSGTINTSVISVTNTAVSLSVGMTVSGTGITPGTTISSISVDPTDAGTRLVKLSQAYTGALATDLQFTPAAGATITGTYGTLVIQPDGSYTYTATTSVDGSVDTFTYELKDPNGGTDTATLKITIINGNVAPVNTIANKTAIYGTPLTFSSGLSVSDANTNVTSTTLSVGYGTLNATATGSGSVSTNGTSSITLSGTQAEINTMLASLTYSAASGFDSGTDTLRMVSTDAVGLSDTDTVNITVNTPAVTVTGTTVNEASAYLMFSVTGVVGQKVTLALGTTGTGAGYATIGDDILPNLEYYNGTTWLAYTGSAVSIPNFNSGALLVRVAVLQDTAYEGAETLKLTATNSSSLASSGNSTIVDDGSGTKYDGTITGTSPTSSTSNLDDDRPLSVNNITVNEASPYAVFEVTGIAGQKVASLALVDGMAQGGSDYGTAFEYFNGSIWTAYSPSITLDGTGKLLVRTTIINDTATPVYEGAETFGLVATNIGGRSFSGTAVILDDGTGDIYQNNITGVKDLNPTNLDRDSAVSVTSFSPVNEGSNFAMFNVTGTAGVALELLLNNGTTTLDLNSTNANYAKIEYSTDGASWTTYTWNGTTGDKPTAPGSSGNGTFFVRVTITSEIDTVYEGPETFNLIATTIATGTNLTQSASATSTIIDNGTGTLYNGTITSGVIKSAGIV
jgi:VCBS repeat-containing protein